MTPGHRDPSRALPVLVLVVLSLLATAAAAAAPPLGLGRVAALVGAATRDGRPLRLGDPVGDGARVLVATGGAARLDLRFPDAAGGAAVLRLGPGTDATLRLAGRRIELRAGRALVQADHMVGGLAVITSLAAFVPVGTTYLVEVAPGGAAAVTVLEGAVAVAPTGSDKDHFVLPGESLALDPGKRPGAPVVRPLRTLLTEEPLLADGVGGPLLSAARIADLSDQQRRGVLLGRNTRLRHELRWRRPPRRDLVLPEQFRGEGTSIVIPLE